VDKLAPAALICDVRDMEGSSPSECEVLRGNSDSDNVAIDYWNPRTEN
jgi:hypothetical protein